MIRYNSFISLMKVITGVGGGGAGMTESSLTYRLPGATLSLLKQAGEVK